MPQSEVLPPEIPNDSLRIEIKALEALLRVHGIPVDEWGVDGAKTLTELYYELNIGRARVHVTESRQVLRSVSVAAVDVFHTTTTGEVYKLREGRLFFRNPDDNLEELPSRRLSTSIGKTMERGETIAITARRGLLQKLQVQHPQSLQFIA